MDMKYRGASLPKLGSATSLRGKQPYVEPQLVEWGSLVDLTQGPILDNAPTDADFSGVSQPAS